MAARKSGKRKRDVAPSRARSSARPRPGGSEAPAPPSGPPPGGVAWRRLGLAALLAVAATWLVLASVVKVGHHERVVRIVPGGDAVRLAPGLHLVPPIGGRLVRLPQGALHAKGVVDLRSREGSDLKAAYEVAAEIPDEALGALLARAGAPRDPAGFLASQAAGAIRAWSANASGEALVLGDGLAAAEKGLRDHLADLGFASIHLRLGPVEGEPGLKASIAARALKDRMTTTGVKVALLGLDGADWEVIDPLIARGRLPNLARLKARAAWGPMKSMDPMLSPLLWTTVATGKSPEQHGIIDFLVRDPRTHKPVPVSSRARRVKALWNILSDADRTVDVIAWWATWPADQIHGHMVTDRVAYSTFSFTPELKDRAGATWPPEYFDTLRPLVVSDASIPDSALRRFADATPEEFRRLARIVASARTYQAAALDLLSRGQPDLFALYYQGIDEVSHRFAHFMPPKMAMVTQDEYRRYHGTVQAYYEYQDTLLGEILRHLDPGTTVIVLSDHGFRNGGGRPQNDPPYIEGKPGLWHRRYGIFLMAGPEIHAGRLDTTSLLDVAPTVLYLLGLPTAEDMPGRVVKEAIDPAFLGRVPVRTVPSYEEIGRPFRSGGDLVADSRVDEEMMEKLRSLGYIGGSAGEAGTAEGAGGSPEAGQAGGGEALITAYVNEATLRLKSKEYAKAEAAVEEALKISPTLVPALILKSQIAREQKQYDRAIDTAKKILELDPEGERQSYTQIASVYADADRTSEGIAYLRTMARAHPAIGEIRAALGSLLLKSGDRDGAETELLASLRIDPSLGEPLAELYTLYKGTDKIVSLEAIVRKGLAINDQSVVHHNWMGLIYQWKKEYGQAEQEFRRAMDLDPDYAATLANMGALYGRTGRLDEAVSILERAVAKDDNNLEAWVNLGAAEGRLKHAKKAIAALETARRKGVRTTTLFNALALAYLQDHQKEKAVEYLRESLGLDPDQKDAKELLQAISRPA